MYPKCPQCGEMVDIEVLNGEYVFTDKHRPYKITYACGYCGNLFERNIPIRIMLNSLAKVVNNEKYI